MQRALTEQALALLLPPSLHLSFSTQPSLQPAQHNRMAAQLTGQNSLPMPTESQHAQHDPQTRPGTHLAVQRSLPTQMGSQQDQLESARQEGSMQMPGSTPAAEQQHLHQQPQHQQQPPRRQSSHLLRCPSQSEARQGVFSDGVQYRLLPGSSDGTGMNSTRGSLWAMVAPVNQLIPLTLLVSTLW